MPPSPPIVLYLPHTMTDTLQMEMPELMQRAQVPGVSVSIVRDGKLASSGAYGLLRAGEPQPVTSETVFQAASLSKPVFAYAVLQLIATGELDLDRPLTDYGAEPFAADDACLHEVTARHVLSHTTGWPNWRPKGEPLRCETPPGDRFGYSGEGFAYLQHVVEHITREPLEPFMQSRVLQPLAMRTSSFDAPKSDAQAAGHDSEAKPLWPRESQRPSAAFSLRATPTDLARFIAGVIAAPGRMLEPQVRVNDRVSWALGWGLETSSEGRAFWHWGDNPGFKSFAIGLPDTGAGAVVMTNADGGRPLCAWVIERLLGTDHPALEWLARRYQSVSS